MQWHKITDLQHPIPINTRILLCDKECWIFFGSYDGKKFEYSIGEEPGTQITHWAFSPELPKEYKIKFTKEFYPSN